MSDELPYGGTVKSFREDVARLAARGEAVFGETVLKAPPRARGATTSAYTTRRPE